MSESQGRKEPPHHQPRRVPCAIQEGICFSSVKFDLKRRKKKKRIASDSRKDKVGMVKSVKK
jgi:hypothetical protein